MHITAILNSWRIVHSDDHSLRTNERIPYSLDRISINNRRSQ